MKVVMAISDTISETHFESHREAMQEAARLRRAGKDSELLVRVESSPYGGYNLKLIPIDIAIDMADQFPMLFSNRSNCER